MELRERFLNSIFVLVLFTLAACSVEVKENKHVVVDNEAVNTKYSLGRFYVDGSLFTGSLYEMYANKKDTAFVRNYLHGKEHGVWKVFYSNRHLKEIRHYKQGKKEGEYIAWWSNGKKKLLYHFKLGEYEGTCREWNPDGRLIKEMNYKKGQEDGSQKIWYNNGKIKSNYVVKKGRRYGLLGTKNCINVSDDVFPKK